MWGDFNLFFTTGLPSYVLYPSLGITLTLVLIGIFTKSIKAKTRFILWVLLIEYVFVLISSTVIFRTHITNARWELMPFWTYLAVFDRIQGVSVWNIILNVALFIPFGLLTKLLFPRIGLIKIILLCMFCSLCIEALQNVFNKGISQFDDIMHNTIGGTIGWMIAGGLTKYIGRKKQ